MDAISAVSTWSAMVNESSVLPFDEPDGEGCLDVASAAELDLPGK